MDRLKGDKGPEDFANGMRDILETFFPHIFERVNSKDFRLVDPMAYNRIAIKPEVRIPYTTVSGNLILGCGDSVVLNDPITGQGANTASYCAEMLYNVLSENIHGKWDVSLGELYWERIKEYTIKMSEWTNAMMGPLSESFAEMLGMASQNPEIADKFVNMFTNPIEAHEVFFKKIKI
jgi:flavin-dependent dehydrogenase